MCQFFHIVDSMIMMPLGDIFMSTFDLTAGQFSYLVSAYAIAAFFSCILGIFYLDVFDRKKALLVIFGGFSIGTLCCSFADSYLLLISLRLGTGFFGGMLGALSLSIVSDLYPFQERGSAMGILMTGFSVATALGVPFALYLAADGNWQLPFLVLGSACLVVWIGIYVVFPKMNKHIQTLEKNRSLRSVLNSVLGDSNQVNALIAGFGLVLAHFLIIPFISPYLIKNVGISQMDITYQFLLGGIATIISSPLIGKMVDKYGVMKIFITTMILSFVPTILLTHIGVTPLFLTLVFTTSFFILATGRMIAPNTIITAAASPSSRGSFMSFKSAFQQLAIALSAFISGAIMYVGEDDKFVNYPFVGYLAIIFGILSIFLVRRIKVAKGN